MNKIINPGTIEGHNVFIRIETEQKEKGLCLSITGVVGPKSNGDAWGSCGQIVDHIDEIDAIKDGWTREMLDKLRDAWNRWHLNDMNAACPHQIGPEWDTSRMINFVGYQRTKKAEDLDKSAMLGPLSPDDYLTIQMVEKYHGESLNASMIPQEVTGLIKAGYLEPWHWNFIEKSERAGLVNVKSGGLLSKPCPVCGYKYGTAWLFEEIPADVLQWLENLPDTKITPAWV
jgi:hypothetical protein